MEGGGKNGLVSINHEHILSTSGASTFSKFVSFSSLESQKACVSMV
jgi:hypothetical protein